MTDHKQIVERAIKEELRPLCMCFNGCEICHNDEPSLEDALSSLEHLIDKTQLIEGLEGYKIQKQILVDNSHGTGKLIWVDVDIDTIIKELRDDEQ